MTRFLPLLMLVIGLAAGEAATIEVRDRLWRFGSTEHWDVWWESAGVRPYGVTTTPDATILEIHKGQAPLELPLLDSRFVQGLRPDSPELITLSVVLEAGDGVEVGLNLTDAKGMSGCMGLRALAPGGNRLEWRTTDKPLWTWGTVHPGGMQPPLRLWNLMIKRPAGAAARLRFTGAEAMRRERAVDAVELSLVTGSPIGVVTVGEEEGLALALANRGPREQTLALATHWEDWDGRVQREHATLTVAAGAAQAWKPRSAFTRRGAWKVDCTLTDAAGQSRSERFWFARLDQPPPRRGRGDGFLFGVNSGIMGPGHDADQTRSIEALRRCNARVTRAGVNWEYVSHAAGQWDQAWFDWFGLQLEALDAVGVEAQFLLAYTAKWAAPRELQQAEDMRQWLFSPPPPEAWRSYVQEMATRFHDRIRFWEVWNETDIVDFWPGTYEQYDRILRVSHDVLKAADPQAQVLTSGFAILAGHGGKKDPEFARKVVTRSRESFDVLALHLHGPFPGFRSQVDDLLPPLRAACVPEAPIYFNETAVNVDEGGERFQAVHLAKKVLYTMGIKAVGYTWYNLRSGRRIPIPGGDVNWGLLTEDWYPRPAFSAFATLAGRLAEARSEGFVTAAPGRIALALREPTAAWFAAWDEDAARSAGPQLVEAGAEAIAVAIDLMGDERNLPVVEGKVLWDVGREPGLLRLANARPDAGLQAPLITCARPPIAVPGRELQVPLVLRNPLARPMRMRLRPAAPKGWTIAIPEQTVAIQPGGEATTVFALQVPPGLRYGDMPAMALAFECLGTAWTGTMQVPLPVGALIPAGGWERPADLTLADRACVVNQNENVPQRAHLAWAGAADCSARAWLQLDGERLRLRVSVQDDKHRQIHSEGGIWQGDSIQFGISGGGRRGFWELGLAMRDDGAVQAVTWLRPEGQGEPLAVAERAVVRVGTTTRYDIAMPLTALGMTARDLREGIGFNLVVNDDDGDDREGWMQLAPGIAERKDSSEFPTIRFE